MHPTIPKIKKEKKQVQHIQYRSLLLLHPPLICPLPLVYLSLRCAY